MRTDFSTFFYIPHITFQISFVNMLRNQGRGRGVRKDYTITGGRGDLKGPKKGLRNQFIAPNFLSQLELQSRP